MPLTHPVCTHFYCPHQPAGESEPHLLAMREYLSAARRQLVAVEAGLMPSVFRRSLGFTAAERVLALQCTERMCDAAVGRAELIGHIALENLAALMQDDAPTVRLAITRLVYRLTLHLDTHEPMINAGYVDLLVARLHEAECIYARGVIAKTAIAALANMTHLARVGAAIGTHEFLRRVLSLARAWHVGHDEAAVIDVLKLVANFTIDVDSKDAAIACDAVALVCDILTLTTAAVGSGSGAQGAASSASAPRAHRASISDSDAGALLSDDEGRAVSQASVQSDDDGQQRPTRLDTSTHGADDSFAASPEPSPTASSAWSTASGGSQARSMQPQRARNVETLRYCAQLLVSLSISEDGKRAVLAHAGGIASMARLAADGMICLPAVDHQHVQQQFQQRQMQKQQQMQHQSSQTSLLSAQQQPPALDQWLIAPLPVGAFTGAEVDTGIRQNCCHVLRHVAENMPRGQRVVGRALIECGEVMLFILGAERTAEVLMANLGMGADQSSHTQALGNAGPSAADEGGEPVTEELLLNALFVLEVLLSTAGGAVALWACLGAADRLLDLIGASPASNHDAAAIVTDRVRVGAARQLLAFCAQIPDAHRQAAARVRASAALSKAVAVVDAELMRALDVDENALPQSLLELEYEAEVAAMQMQAAEARA